MLDAGLPEASVDIIFTTKSTEPSNNNNHKDNQHDDLRRHHDQQLHTTHLPNKAKHKTSSKHHHSPSEPPLEDDTKLTRVITSPTQANKTHTPKTSVTSIDTLRIITHNALSINDNIDPPKNSKGKTANENPGLRGLGQLTYLTEQLLEKEVFACCIQEARLSLPSQLQLRHYHIYQVPHNKGHEGLLILIHKRPEVKILRELTVYTRLHYVTFKYYHHTITLFNGHAPPRDHPQTEHDTYQAALKHHINTTPRHHKIVICCDLNARLGTMEETYQCVGPFNSPIRGECHVEPLLQFLSERNFYFINTFLPPTSSPQHQNPTSDATQQALTTWRMPKRKCHNIVKQYQIDFIICNHSATRATTNCCVMEWETFSTIHTSDHRPVQATLLLDTEPHRPTHTPRTLTRFTDNEHKQKHTQHFAELCKDFYNDPCTAA
eukprot:3683824-Amphidinium_carterae.2